VSCVPNVTIIMIYWYLKVAPYSFTMSRVLRMKGQIICARSKENVSVFWYFMTSTWAQKAKLTVNFLWQWIFPSVKFRNIWQTGSKYFTLVRACFQGNLWLVLQKLKTTTCTNPNFLCLKFVSRKMQCAVKILEDFTNEIKKITSTVQLFKKVKNINFVWAFIIQD